MWSIWLIVLVTGISCILALAFIFILILSTQQAKLHKCLRTMEIHGIAMPYDTKHTNIPQKWQPSSILRLCPRNIRKYRLGYANFSSMRSRSCQEASGDFFMGNANKSPSVDNIQLAIQSSIRNLSKLSYRKKYGYHLRNLLEQSSSSPLSTITESSRSPQSQHTLADSSTTLKAGRFVKISPDIPYSDNETWPLYVPKTRKVAPSSLTHDKISMDSDPTTRNVGFSDLVSRSIEDKPNTDGEDRHYDHDLSSSNIKYTGLIIENRSAKSVQDHHPSYAQESETKVSFPTLFRKSPARQVLHNRPEQRDAITSWRASFGQDEHGMVGATNDPTCKITAQILPVTEYSSYSRLLRRHSMFAITATYKVPMTPVLEASNFATTNLSPRPLSTNNHKTWYRNGDDGATSIGTENETRLYRTPQLDKTAVEHNKKALASLSRPPVPIRLPRRRSGQLPSFKKGRPGNTHKDHSRFASIANSLQSTNEGSIWPEPLNIKRSALDCTIKCTDTDVFMDTGSLLSQNHCMLREEAGENSTRSGYVSSRDSSPVLPSPAYTAAGLFPNKSRSKKPRKLPPLPISPTIQRSNLQQLAPSSLRKSVVLLRRMNSEGHLLDSKQRNLYRNLDDEQTVCESLASSSTHASLKLRNDDVAAGNAIENPSTPLRKVMTASRSDISIWEDVPANENSSAIQTPDPLHRSLEGMLGHNNTVSTGMIVSSGNVSTPYLVPSLTNINKAAKSKAVDGSQVEKENTNWETPGSLYDQQGFLKDRV